MELRMQRGGWSWGLRSADVRLVCLERDQSRLHQKPVCLGSGVSPRLGQGSSPYPAVEISLRPGSGLNLGWGQGMVRG